MDDQKLENQLNLALDVPESVREKSLDLDVGFDEELQLWELIVKYNGDIQRLEEELNIVVEILTNQYAVLTVPENLIDRLTNYTEVEFIEKPKRLFFSLESGYRAACIPRVQEPPYNLRGEGVIVAVIDSGIDYTHLDFRNEDGTTRIIELWDQTIPGNPPEGYEQGSVFTREQINLALEKPNTAEQLEIVPSVDLSGHGTHVTGIAAGNGRASRGRYTGVSPESELLIVKLGMPEADSFPRTTELMRAISYVIYKAQELARPIAVNLSFGNNYGSHDGSSLLETFIDDISNVWKSSIVIGSGNEGAAGHHTSGIIEEDSTEEVEIVVGNAERSLNIQIWKSYYDNFNISIIGPGGVEVGPLTRRLGTQRFNVGRTQVFVYYGEPQPYNMAQEIYLDLVPVFDDYIDEGIWTIRLIPSNIIVGNYDMWLPTREVLQEQTQFLRPTVDTTLTIPSTASKAITVGAYNSLTNSVADFSGRGYTRNQLMIKPELAAPGVDIVAPTPGGGYDSKSGTSMATPFVTGASALLMQWGIVQEEDPFLYGEKIKAYFLDGTNKPIARLEYPNNSLGYGTLCLQESFEKAVFITSVSNEGLNRNKEKKVISLLLPVFIKGYKDPVTVLSNKYLKNLIDNNKRVLVSGFYVKEKKETTFNNNVKIHNLNQDKITFDEYVVNMLPSHQWVNEFLSVLEENDSSVFCLDTHFCSLHPLDMKSVIKYINAVLNKNNSKLVLNHQLLTHKFALYFSKKDRRKKIQFYSATNKGLFTIFLYGYALDEYNFSIKAPTGEIVYINNLNKWKEDKNRFKEIETTVLIKRYQKDKLTPFLVKIDFLKLKKGDWEIGLDGEIVIDGRINFMPSDLENIVFHFQKTENTNIGKNVLVVDAAENKKSSDDINVLYIPLSKYVGAKINSLSTIEKSRLACYIGSLFFAKE
ncbi:MAG: S8 family serine peptidase [Eubacteriales bacterium]